MSANTTSRRRHGFTLIEMVTSLAIMSVLLLGLSGAVMVSAHAIPTATDTGLADQMVVKAINTLRADLREAKSIQSRSGSGNIEIKLEMNSAGATGTPSMVTYLYTESSHSLSRQVDSEDEYVAVSNLAAIAFSPTTVDGKAHRVHVILQVDQTIQSVFELHAALPYTPEVK